MKDALERQILEVAAPGTDVDLQAVGARLRLAVEGSQAAVVLTLGYPLGGLETAQLRSDVAGRLEQQGVRLASFEVGTRVQPHAVQPKVLPLSRVRNIIAIGSGGNYALAAARALVETDKDAETIVRRALDIAADICVYTNRNVTIETL